jgi:hypothetical protein
MVGPGEALLGVAVAPEEIGLPRAIGGDAGHLVDFRLVGDRVGGVGRCRGDDEVDLVAEDQIVGDFRSAVAARLAVLADDLHRISLAAADKARSENAAHSLEDEIVGLAEARQRPRARADMADLDDAALGVDRDDPQHCGCRQRAQAAGDNPAARYRPGLGAITHRFRHNFLPMDASLGCCNYSKGTVASSCQTIANAKRNKCGAGLCLIIGRGISGSRRHP